MSKKIECAECNREVDRSCQTCHGPLCSIHESWHCKPKTEDDENFQDGKVAGLDLSIAEAEKLLALATLLGYKEAYLQAFREFLVYARAMRERVNRGEYPHPVSWVE